MSSSDMLNSLPSIERSGSFGIPSVPVIPSSQMMVDSSFNPSKISKIFGDSYSVIATTSEVLHTYKFQKLLTDVTQKIEMAFRKNLTCPPLQRTRVMKEKQEEIKERQKQAILAIRGTVQEIWAKAVTNISNLGGVEFHQQGGFLEGLSEEFKARFTELGKTELFKGVELPSFYSVFEPQLTFIAKDIDQLKVAFAQNAKINEHQGTDPLIKSTVGQIGQLFLVGYARSGDGNYQNYVLKWTDWNEVATNLVYGAFSNAFNEPGISVGFKVPRTACLDLTQSSGVHQDDQGRIQRLDPVTTERIKSIFSEIVLIPSTKDNDGFDSASSSSSSSSSKAAVIPPIIMLSERIKGENLHEFITKKYRIFAQSDNKDLDEVSRSKLTDIKMKFFERLGRLAYLDLLIGNHDRFFKVKTNNESAEDNELEALIALANLGNVMVEWSGDSRQQSENPSIPVISAIDNLVEANLIDDKAERGNYLKFLTAQLSKKPELLAKKLAECMLVSVTNSIALKLDQDGCKDIKKVMETLEPFIDDMKALGPKAFEKGILGMDNWLRKTALTSWNGEDNKELKAHLSKIQPDLLASIEERFNVLNK